MVKRKHSREAATPPSERLLHCSRLVNSKRMDDREWMYTGRSSQGLLTDEWIEKTDAFLELAFAKVKGARATWCPCSICANMHRQTKMVMGRHLCKNGFTADYTRWIYHGEAGHMRDEVMRQRMEDYDPILDTATTPTLSHIRARSMSSNQTIRPRSDTAQSQIEALQAQLQEERRMWEEMERRMEVERQRMEVEQQRMAARMVADRQMMEKDRQMMEQMVRYMQDLCEKMGLPVPPMLFSPPPPTTTPTTPIESVASNNGPYDQDLS